MPAVSTLNIRFLAHDTTLYRVWDRKKSARPVTIAKGTECEVRERRDGRAFIKVRTPDTIAYGWVSDDCLSWAPF